MKRVATMAVLLGVVVLGACSRGDDAASPSPPTSRSSEESVPTPAAATDAAETSNSSAPASPGRSASASSPSVSSTSPGTPGAAPTSAGAPVSAAVTVSELDEIGTPGLDSNDAFCAAWSRFAGSFQVVAVTAAFGSGPPEDVAALEVAAAPVVVDAYAEMFEHWPGELESERELVADRSLGPFARRLEEAREALLAAGADDAEVARIADAWLDGLAQRDPSTPEFAVDLPDEAWSMIDAAAASFAARRVPFSSDPSLVTAVDTPLTDAYLATSCPDQGTLAGQEVDSP